MVSFCDNPLCHNLAIPPTKYCSRVCEIVTTSGSTTQAAATVDPKEAKRCRTKNCYQWATHPAPSISPDKYVICEDCHNEAKSTTNWVSAPTRCDHTWIDSGTPGGMRWCKTCNVDFDVKKHGVAPKGTSSVPQIASPKTYTPDDLDNMEEIIF